MPGSTHNSSPVLEAPAFSSALNREMYRVACESKFAQAGGGTLHCIAAKGHPVWQRGRQTSKLSLLSVTAGSS